MSKLSYFLAIRSLLPEAGCPCSQCSLIFRLLDLYSPKQAPHVLDWLQPEAGSPCSKCSLFFGY